MKRRIKAQQGRVAASSRLLGNVPLTRVGAFVSSLPVLIWQFAQDARFALRAMRRQPGFSVAAISMLTVGLGLIAGGYTVFNGLFLRGWALPESAQVFRVDAERTVTPVSGYIADGFSVEAYEHIRANARSADYVAMTTAYFRVSAESGAAGVHTPGIFASSNLIDALRIPLQVGSGFGTSSTTTEPKVVISDSLWRLRFGADPNIVGRTAWLTGVPTSIVGVTASSFEGLAQRRLDVIIEMSSAKAWSFRSTTSPTNRTACCVTLAGRIRGGWSRAQVRQELGMLIGRFRQSTGQPALSVALASTAPMGRSQGNDSSRFIFSLIGAGIVLVLLLTCANVGNLYLARSLRRRGEIAVRLSLGASRARIVRQLLTEGLVMASIAGACAFLMTTGVPVLLRLLEDRATATMFGSDWRVAAFTVCGVVVTCLLVSLAPALQTTRIAWRGATATMSARTGRVRGFVLATQIAIAAVLVLSAILLARGIGYAVRIPADYALKTTTVVTLEPTANHTLDTEGADTIRAALSRAIHDSALPVGMAGVLPTNGEDTSVRPAHSEVAFRCKLVSLSAAAFAVLNLKLASGRLASDDPGAGEAIVNETLARQIWPAESALGKVITLHRNRRAYLIVGIVRDAHLTSLSNVEPMVSVPPSTGLPILLVRTTAKLEDKIRALVASTDPRLTVTLMPLSTTVMQTLENAAIGARLAAGLAIVALLLAIIGIYGVFAYVVEERRREIGIRLALGASRVRIGISLLRVCRSAIVVGLLLGLTCSAIAGMALRRFLFGLSPADPVTYLIVAAVLTTAAIVATAVPVGRALHVDPAVTLRGDG
jgi:putative ABC transport system permease protein